jgi:hypothetical protein
VQGDVALESGSTAMNCRFCHGPLLPKFRLPVLRKFDVQYLECAACNCLQTETPYWLGEAYASNLSDLDSGAAQRNLTNLAVCYVVAKLLGARNAVDFGGGDGLLCRLLRDYGINCFVKDKYASPTYAQTFTTPDFHRPDLAIAFEVLEHFANPSADLQEIFNLGAPAILVSTEIYAAQKADWWYLSPNSGQHVFFYSKHALSLIASKYAYMLTISDHFILFTKPGLLSPAKARLLSLLMKRRMRRLIRSAIVLLPARGLWRDHLASKGGV